MPLNYFSQRTRFHIASLWLIALTMMNIVLAVRSAGENDRVGERVTAAIATSDQRWCTVFNILLEAADDNPPPATQYGRDQLKAFRELHKEFGCQGTRQGGGGR